MSNLFRKGLFFLFITNLIYKAIQLIELQLLFKFDCNLVAIKVAITGWSRMPGQANRFEFIKSGDILDQILAPHKKDDL